MYINTPQEEQTAQSKAEQQAPIYVVREETKPAPGSPYEVLSVGQYLIMFIVMSIPIINIILMIVWATSPQNQNRKNFAIASIILLLVGFIFSLVTVFFLLSYTKYLIDYL